MCAGDGDGQGRRGSTPSHPQLFFSEGQWTKGRFRGKEDRKESLMKKGIVKANVLTILRASKPRTELKSLFPKCEK